jgi:tRNA-Thr(GGU) m(6)t(6)A37 methyltransferase TsaA
MFMADLSIFNIPESGYNISDRICESIFARAPMDEWKMRPIGYIRSDYTRTDQVPKGLGATHTMEGTLEILPEYEKGLQDIEGYSHLLILWVFHQAPSCELVGKAPSDDTPHGVFSTRSPRRPNPIGLTTVELIRREGASLFLRGIDMLDGTPVIDIKPYTSSIPMEQLRRGWLEEAEKRRK